MTDAIWAIIHAIVATVAFAAGFRIAAKIREWRDNTRNIEREIPFSLFLEAYGKAPDRWKLKPYFVQYGADHVRFENYADYRKYKKWREKRKRDAEEERKRSANERLFREIQSDLVPTPPKTGSSAITPKSNEPPTIHKPTKSANLREGIKKYAEWDDGVVRVDGAKLVPQPAETCGDCPWASGNYPDVAICGIDHHAHLRSERCKYRKQAALVYNPAEESVKRYERDFIDAKCGKCRQFDKGDNSPFGYCFRNDEIVNEASVKGCFEPKNKAEEHPEPLGTVTTH